MDLIYEIFKSDIFQIIFKLLLSGILTGIIGIERSSMSKPAGFGTHAIIGISSALVVLASEFMASYYDNIDASRIPSQILAGIGFIGAGTIIRNGINVRGVTTAAGILSVTCIGITVGAGYYEAATVATLIVFIILLINHEITGKFERFEILSLAVAIGSDSSKAIDEIKAFFKKHNISIESIKKVQDTINNKKVEIVNFDVTFDIKKIDKNEIVTSLASMKNNLEVSINE